MEEQKKLCRMCYQEIDSRALKCPYCRTSQNRIIFFFQHPLTITMMIIISFLWASYSMTAMTTGLINEGEPFDAYRNQITIVNSKLTHGSSDCGPRLVILGEIENKTDINWENFKMEVKYFDQNNKLIDTAQDHMYSFLVEKNSVVPFKFSMKRELPQEQYVRYDLKILSAKEDNNPF